MKKLFTIMALVLVVALCASFAVSAEKVNTGLGSVSTDVKVEFKSPEEDTSTIVYSVDVEWKDVSFSYSAGTTKWNPEKHDYSASGDSAEWTDATGSVIVTNHSNADVDVAVTFEKASNGSATVDVTNGLFTLASAVDKTAADSKTASLTASGTPTSSAKIGTITVTVSAAQ